MKRNDKIKALAALSKGDSFLIKNLWNTEEKPLFVNYLLIDGLYYLDQDDLVLTKSQFNNYINGSQPMFAEDARSMNLGDYNTPFPNKHLPNTQH